VQEFDQTFPPRRPEPRREIGNRPFGQIAGERVEHGVPEAARQTRLRAPRSRADDEVVGRQLRDQPFRIHRSMLSVGVDDQHVGAGCLPNPGLDGGAVADVVGVPDDVRASLRGTRGGVIGRPVVDNEDVVPRCGGAQRRDDGGDRGRLVECRDDD
jgi:hypothetical protein